MNSSRYLLGILGLTIFTIPFLLQAEELPPSTIKNNMAIYELSCPNNDQRTTLEMNQCSMKIVTQLQAIQKKYILAIYTRIDDAYKDEPEFAKKLLVSFDKENKAWDELDKASSAATYTYWEDGTIRGVMGLGRKIALIKYRIHNQWSNWLTYMDSTPAILPEPIFIDKESTVK